MRLTELGVAIKQVNRTQLNRQRLTPYLFLIPTFVPLTVGYFYPMLQAVYLSFYRTGLGRELGPYVGLENYEQILSDPWFLNALSVSARYCFGSVIGVLIIGLLTAMLLNQSFRGRGLVRSLFLVPWAIPYVTAALIGRWILDFNFGILNYVLDQLHLFSLSGNWLNDPSRAFFTVIVISIWKLFPLATVTYLAALQTIPQELYDAAMVDGANAWQLLRHITIPGVRSATTVLILLVGLWTFGRAFTFIFVLTGGGPVGATENVVLFTYLRAFQFFKPGLASAAGTLVLIISGMVSLVYLVVSSRE